MTDLRSDFMHVHGLSVWLDVKMGERDMDSMERGIRKARKVLIFITESYFKRDCCVQELRWARDMGKELVVCIDVKDKDRIREFVNSAPDDLKCIGSINMIDMNRGDKDYWETGVNKVLTARTKKLPLPRTGTLSH